MILRNRCRRAFTLVELSIATAIFSMLGLVVYGVASEGLYAFARNVSINRSYSDARRAIDRIGLCLQTAGYKPQLVDATGAPSTVSPAAGIRFYRYGNGPCYNIKTPVLTDTSLTLSLYQPGTQTLQSAPVLGDLITVAALGLQATVTKVEAGSSANTAKVSFGPSSSPYVAISNFCSATTISASASYACLNWTSTAIIAVGTQLRYYPTFIPGSTAIDTTTNYKVLTNLTASVAGTTTPLPFSLGPTPSVNVDLYAEAPDYNNRNLGTANTYTFVSTALSPRNPSILSTPY